MYYVFLYVLTFLLVFNSVKSQIDVCKDVYSRFSKEHSYCKPSNSSCEIEQRYLTEEEIKHVLDQHNNFRSIIATQSEKKFPPSANMLQMEWDNELAAVAQKYAEQCQFTHDNPNERRVRNFGVGQNIAIQTITGSNVAPQPDWSFAVTTWFEEVVFFRSELVNLFKSPSSPLTEYRHFTQLIWADTYRVGCGYVLYKYENTFARLYICNYGPAGNVYNTTVYKIGPPCSQCPQNTCPGEICLLDRPTYPGLCKRYNNQAPFKLLQQPAMFYCNFQDKNIEDCLMNVEGIPPFVYSALGGNFLEILLEGGQNSTITFSKHLFPHSNAFCVVINYRKGPAEDGKQANNKAIETFFIPSMNYYANQDLPDFPNRNQFGEYKMTLSWQKETQLKINFAAAANADPQYFDIDSITVVDGAC